MHRSAHAVAAYNHLQTLDNREGTLSEVSQWQIAAVLYEGDSCIHDLKLMVDIRLKPFIDAWPTTPQLIRQLVQRYALLHIALFL
jgi:hypothetical protein